MSATEKIQRIERTLKRKRGNIDTITGLCVLWADNKRLISIARKATRNIQNDINRLESELEELQS